MENNLAELHRKIDSQSRAIETLAESLNTFRRRWEAQPQAGRLAGLGPMPEGCRAGHGFRSTTWRIGGIEVRHSWTRHQAEVIRQLWAAYQNGTPEVDEGSLLLEVGSEWLRVDRIFKLTHPEGRRIIFGVHPGFGTMVVAGSRHGTFRLVEPS
jgi:hypothetical protein